MDKPLWTASEKATVDAIGANLRASGWAAHVTVDRLLRDWQRFADEVRGYPLTVDDYTNDLCARDALAIVLREAPSALREKLERVVRAADEGFRASTVADDNGLLGSFFRIDHDAEWWWRRLPVSGPLADYLRDQHPR